ncbi:MAG: hypothetical protein CMJ18_05670 [Phycisphaeraceae bacterium]|nr:hypothetical protein [Phycisphaeraceae bacterium]
MTTGKPPSTESIDPALPLGDFYAAAGLAPPPLQLMPPESVPTPYDALLVHDRDMTSTLEAHHGQLSSLRGLARREGPGRLDREVVLVGDRDGVALEFGAIRIHLDRFEPQARRLIDECRRPLGAILAEFKIAYDSRPVAFFRVPPDRIIRDALDCGDAEWLYGRHNRLTGRAGGVLADVVEILPPEKPK